MANPTLCLLSARHWHLRVHVALRGASDGASARACASTRVVRGASLLGVGACGAIEAGCAAGNGERRAL